MKKVNRALRYKRNINHLTCHIWYCNNAIFNFVVDWYTNMFVKIVSH